MSIKYNQKYISNAPCCASILYFSLAFFCAGGGRVGLGESIGFNPFVGACGETRGYDKQWHRRHTDANILVVHHLNDALFIELVDKIMIVSHHANHMMRSYVMPL